MINPSRYRILAIGKIRKEWIKEGLNLYLKRLPGLTITELKDSNPQKEAKAILASLTNNEILIALSEEGYLVSSTDLAKQLCRFGSQRLAFVIGGADGLSPDIRNLAHRIISLSSLTFPHEIARLLLVEQIYRAQNILQGGPYHRE